MSISRWKRNLVPFVAIGTVALAACGDDDDSAVEETTADTTEAAAETTEPAAETTEAAVDTTEPAVETTEAPAETTVASGEPIKVMAIGPVDAPGFSLPSIPVGAQVAVDEINSAGGINGRPLELITCNDENNPNIATECARQAIDEGVVAVVGGLTLFEPNVVPPLQEAGIPWVGLTSSSAANLEGVWLIGGDGASAFTAIGAALAQQPGCETIAIVLSANSTDANAAQIEAGVLSEGAQVADTLSAPETGADWAPTVEAARAAGATCIAAGTGPPETGPLIAAINAGEPMPFAVADGGLPGVVLAELGPAADGVLAVSGFLPASSDEGIVQELASKIEAAAPGTSFDQFAKTGYASVQIVLEVVKDLEEVTAASVTEGLAGITDFDTGLGPVVDFSEPIGIPGYERIFNPNIYIYVANNGVYELAQPDPIDMTAALEILSEGQ